jgi:hypothetical protein
MTTNEKAIINNMPFAWEPESKAEIDVSEMFININNTKPIKYEFEF